ncbi:MAG TPA: glucoamylase family protein, partial [Burkholderiaceae bacterium]
LDYSDGIPLESRTLVVVPTMIFDAANVDALCDALEVRFLANRDDNLRFCLLTDFADAPQEHMPGDDALIAQLHANIERLNERYRASHHQPDHGGTEPASLRSRASEPQPQAQAVQRSTDPFLLLHRPRTWNPADKIWMGRERKRGKLADLNALLRGERRERFSVVAGDTSDLHAVRYVITLDTDTALPRDAARKFIATMAHPLNRAHYDDKRGRVTQGYGILQPRVAAALPSTDASLYERLCGGEAGIDPYTRTVSDVYQDLFAEGSFVGKGIYDVDAFEQALSHRMPDNRILSHDLLEGCYARAGLLSDALLYEGYPGKYRDDVARRHRWVRGDWQLASWLLPRVPDARAGDGKKAGKARNPLPLLARWKLFDNLRRSLVPAALTALFLAGWFLSHSPWFWTAAALTILVLPMFAMTGMDLLRKPGDVLVSQHLSSVLRNSLLHGAHALMNLTFLPYEAWFTLDAIARAGWRLLFSRRRLLEWKPSSQPSPAYRRNETLLALRQMWIGPLIAIVAGFALQANFPQAFLAALPVLFLWLVSPIAAAWISRPRPPAQAELQPEQVRFLRHLARKTWAFFQAYVGPRDNWLPPDNMQEHPVEVVARRTSPTNIGLALLANATAYDFGYIGAGAVLERTRNTLDTLDKLERHRGHFYNWYATDTLQPLLPIYVSTVDSGNLAGHLLTMRPALHELRAQPVVPAKLFNGLLDTFEILHTLLAANAPADLVQVQLMLAGAISTPPVNLLQSADLLDRLAIRTQQLATLLDDELDPDAALWAQRLAEDVHAARAELLHMAPWLAMPFIRDSSLLSPDTAAGAPAAEGQAAIASLLNGMPTLEQLAALADTAAPAFHAWASPDAQDSGAAPRGSRADQRDELRRWVDAASERAQHRMAEIDTLCARLYGLAQMDYGFLYNRTTHLLAIGYNVTERRLDASYYDLLASEVRLASFVAIAQGQLPQEHWFAQGRQLAMSAGGPSLLSWSGSMFEYLMPLLVMPTFPNTLLDQTYRASVDAQIAYGKQRDVPWGISESGYNTVDSHMNYQYRAFGVPELGLKRGLADDLVIAPYASMMALMVDPGEACANLQRQSQLGFEGRYGMYEAIDYTPARLPRGQDFAVIRSFMAHHQGMGLLSLSYVLLDQPMQRRFSGDPLFQAAMLLLHERVPRKTALYFDVTDPDHILKPSHDQAAPIRVLGLPGDAPPETQLLSNGRYHVMLTGAGGGYSRWRDLAVTRWREDGTRDHWGSFLYVRDCASGKWWSGAYQPTRAQPDKGSYEAIFTEGRAEFRRRDDGIEMHTEVVVSPEDDIELRRTEVKNRTDRERTLELTTYGEVVMAPSAADSAHPAFSNLFVQTEFDAALSALICTRRPRSSKDSTQALLHMVTVHGAHAEQISAESDRMQFVGRNCTPASPRAMREAGPLSGSTGSVLDPVFAIRVRLTLAPGESASIDVVTGMADDRAGALRLAEKFHDRNLASRVFELAWTHSQVLLRQLNANEGDAQ